MIGLFFFFFFSSRRRHTRLTCDWSSDVCSSDLGSLGTYTGNGLGPGFAYAAGFSLLIGRASCRERVEISVVAVSLKKKKKKRKEISENIKKQKIRTRNKRSTEPHA